jgi:hypothetical protein
MGITVISVPFWWDRSPSSLAATIQLHRPDINIEGATDAIATQMPSKYRTPFTYRPNSPKEYDGLLNPTGW